jgi:hypothetical protein
MERPTEMVKEYADRQEFDKDEQKLGREGWTVVSTVDQSEHSGVVMRIRSLFSPKQSGLVVTYNRSVGG